MLMESKFAINCHHLSEIRKYKKHKSQELEVRSLYHLYILKTKRSRSHYVVFMIRCSVFAKTPGNGDSKVPEI